MWLHLAIEFEAKKFQLYATKNAFELGYTYRV